MTPENAILTIPQTEIELCTEVKHSPTYIGKLNGKNAVFKYELKSDIFGNEEHSLTKEIAFLKAGAQKNIPFIPKLFFQVHHHNYLIIAKEYIPGKTLSEYPIHTLPRSFFEKCEQDISNQIISLYANGMCSNDIARRNILHNPETNNFSLFDYSCGLVSSSINRDLELKVIKELKELFYICNSTEFKNINKYVSNKLNNLN